MRGRHKHAWAGPGQVLASTSHMWHAAVHFPHHARLSRAPTCNVAVLHEAGHLSAILHGQCKDGHAVQQVAGGHHACKARKAATCIRHVQTKHATLGLMPMDRGMPQDVATCSRDTDINQLQLKMRHTRGRETAHGGLDANDAVVSRRHTACAVITRQHAVVNTFYSALNMLPLCMPSKRQAAPVQFLRERT